MDKWINSTKRQIPVVYLLIVYTDNNCFVYIVILALIRSQETRLSKQLSDNKLTIAALSNPPNHMVPGVKMGPAEARAALIRITIENH